MTSTVKCICFFLLFPVTTTWAQVPEKPPDPLPKDVVEARKKVGAWPVWMAHDTVHNGNIPKRLLMKESNMTQITIPAQVVNGHLQHEKSLGELEGQHVLATLTVVPKDAVWQKWRDKIDSMKMFEDGWDSYRAPAPSPDSISHASVFLEEVANADNVPERLAPSVVGGIGFTFKRENRKVYVEFRNTGSVHALFSDVTGDPVVEKIQSDRVAYSDLMARIKKYLYE